MSLKMSETGITQKPPPELVEPAKEAHFKLTALDKEDKRFKEISADFQNAGLEVTTVEFLSYHKLWERYTTNKRWILQDREKTDPSFELNEKYMYHGTSVNKDDISEEGLDIRMSKQGCFGNGIYFSDFPRKCVKYAKKGDANKPYVLLVRVILGESKVFPKGRKDRTISVFGPRKEEPYKGDKFYDSVEGCPTNHKEFVVYKSERTLVEGFITFKVIKKPQTLQPEDGEKSCDYSSSEESENSDLSDVEDLSSHSSDDEDDNTNADVLSDGSNDFEDAVEEHGHDLDADTSSSEDEDDDGEAGAEGLDAEELEKAKIEKILEKKRKEFSEATEVTDAYEIDRYLLLGTMNIQEAVEIYNEKKAQGFPEDEIEEEETTSHPIPDSEEWKELGKTEQDAIIEELIDDFMATTQLDTEQREMARKILTDNKMDLKAALFSYYKVICD